MLLTHRYATRCDDLNKLTQTFNTILIDQIAVVIDEPEVNSSKQMQKLKSTITALTQFAERKNKDGFERDSYNRLFLTCNHLDSVNLNPTGLGEPAGSPLRRRFECVVVSSERVGDNAFFTKLSDIIESPGFGKALFDHCRHVDLSGFRVRDFPETGDEELFFGKLKPSGQQSRRTSAKCMLDY